MHHRCAYNLSPMDAEHNYLKKKRFDEDIWLISKLYTGSSCDLYLAFWPEEDEQVVIKTVRPDIEEENKGVIEERLLKEASTLEEFWNSSFPKVYDIRKKEDTGNLYLILEHFDGNSLRDYLNLNNEKGLNKSFIDQFLKQISQILHYLHHKKNICHLDLTPENIIIDFEQNAHVIDFEESQVIGQKIKSNKVRGKANYMAPEFHNPNENSTYSGAADIYAVGIILKEIYEKTKGLKSSQKKYYQSIIRNCIARRPEIRPSAFNILDAPTTSPIAALFFSLQEYLYNKKIVFISILLALASIAVLVSTPKEVITQRPVAKRRIIKKKVAKRSPRKKIVKAKLKKRPRVQKRKKRIVKLAPYKKVLNTVINQSSKKIDRCLSDYSSKRSSHRYKIIVLPSLAKLDRIIPLSKSPRRLTYCLSQVFENARYPKRSNIRTISTIKTFSQKSK